MSILRIKDIYMQMCHQSNELHILSEEERTKLQAHLRKMYVDIETVCNSHNLTVMLAYGSLLGAIRHQGFIPWDDDLDLYMPRNDYNLFINKYAKELPNNYILYAPNSINGPTYQFGKVFDNTTLFIGPGGDKNRKGPHGVFVDIFPLENIGTNKIKNKCNSLLAKALIGIAASVGQYKSQSILYKKLMCGHWKGKIAYYIRHFIGYCFSFYNYKKWYNILDKLFQQKKETNYLHEPSGIYSWTPIPKDVYLPVKRVKFDDIEVNIPNNPYFLLERDYGDWHYIPSKEERWEHFIVEIKL